MSGMPDLTLSFMNPRLFDDVSFHPCVRFKRWEVRKCRYWMEKKIVTFRAILISLLLPIAVGKNIVVHSSRR